MNRQDTETAFFGAAVGGAVAAASLRAGVAFYPAALTGASAAFGCVAVLYGVGLLTRSLPAAAASIVEFGMVVRSPTLAQGVPARAALVLDESQDGVPPDREQRWRVELRRFLLAGRLAGGLSIRLMVGKHLVTDTGYRTLAGALKDNAILVASNAGTAYAQGFDYGRAVWTLKHLPLALPDGEPARLQF